jgi:hypothetical protein
MGVKFPKRENPFAKYFSKESPIATTQFEEPKMDNYFSSEDVLGRPTAKNTAQRGMSESEQMKAAYEALMKPNALSFLEKQKGPTSGIYQESVFGQPEEVSAMDRMTLNVATGRNEATEKRERNTALSAASAALKRGVPYSQVVADYPKAGLSNVLPMAWSGSGVGFKKMEQQAMQEQPVQQQAPFMMGNKPLSEIIYNYNP